MPGWLAFIFQMVTKYERDSNGIENKLSKEKYSAWLSILAKDPGYLRQDQRGTLGFVMPI